MSQYIAHEINPLQDARWHQFLEHHPRSSVFHTNAWLKALNETYGYEPVGITTSAPGQPLQSALVFCSVNSWLTGRRLVSLPFSDHCDVLADSILEQRVLFRALEQKLHRGNLLYFEMRPTILISEESELLRSRLNYYHDRLDLTPTLETIHRSFHKDSVQRKIRRAEREGLLYEEGASPSLLDRFYNLLLLTRRRHHLPPQPRVWFENLIRCFGRSLKIRVASKGTVPVAAILTLRHKETITYKYGCLDVRHRSLGGTQLLFWKTIQEAKSEGMRAFDLGRSECTNEGLLTFKRRWGAERSPLSYSRFAAASAAKDRFGDAGWKDHMARLTCRLPDQMFATVGTLLYKHFG